MQYTLQVLKRQEFKRIDYSKLVPSFADISTDNEDKLTLILEFLEKYVIGKLRCKERSVHNMAFYFMTKMHDLEPMIGYLKMLEIYKEQKEGIYLDLEYAFNQCNQERYLERPEKVKECLIIGQIIIYGILGLYEKAVDLALTSKNYDLAKKYASKSFIDQKLKKNLWLKIAKKILNESQDGKEEVKKALDLLDETKDILRIDDLLPYFPPATPIEVLKEKLCESLRSYNDRINNLKNELSEQSKNAEDLREKNKKFKNKFISVHPTQTCEICFTSLLSQTFYAFHCGHGFHRECLIDELEHYETKNYKLVSKVDLIKAFAGAISSTKSKAAFLRNEEQSMDPQDRAMSWFSGFAKKIRNSFAPGAAEMDERAKLSAEDQKKVDDLYSQIDMRLKEECYLCGEMLLDTLDNDIAVDVEDEDKVKYMYYEQKNSWEID